MRFAEQREMFDTDNAAMCARHDLGICLAPCAMRCSRAEYNARVRRVKQFLRGKESLVLTQLEEAMRTAASGQRFEEAAVYRDRWEALGKLHEQLDRLRTAQREYNFIYPMPSRDSGSTLYLICRGQVVAAVDEPRECQTADQCLAVIEEIYGSGKSLAAQTAREDVEITLLVAGWFRSRPNELRRTLQWEAVKEELRVRRAVVEPQ